MEEVWRKLVMKGMACSQTSGVRVWHLGAGKEIRLQSRLWFMTAVDSCSSENLLHGVQLADGLLMGCSFRICCTT